MIPQDTLTIIEREANEYTNFNWAEPLDDNELLQAKFTKEDFIAGAKRGYDLGTILLKNAEQRGDHYLQEISRLKKENEELREGLKPKANLVVPQWIRDHNADPENH